MADSAAEPVFRREMAPAFQVLAQGLEFPEGPVALSDGSVLVVEIKGGTLKRVDKAGKTTVVARLGGGPNGAAIGPDGRCYITNNGGHLWTDTPGGPLPAGMRPDYNGGSVQAVNLDTGAFETLYTEHDRGKLTSPNDLVFDAFGGFWFTDNGKKEGRKVNYGSVCYALPDGSSIREVIWPLISPNGIGLSPSGDRLYVAETHTSRLWAFDVIGPGQIAPKPWPSPNGGELVCNIGGYRLLDSLAVDAVGNIHVATLVDQGIACVSPDGTAVVHTALPDFYTTNICFGGPDRKTAYVTQSQSGQLVAFRSEVAGLKLNYNR